MSTDVAAAKPAALGPIPLDFIPGLKQNFKFDIVSGLILFLIVPIARRSLRAATDSVIASAKTHISALNELESKTEHLNPHHQL